MSTTETRLYIDARMPDRDHGYRIRVFGPFSERGAAERALTVLMGREDVLEAIIRDPDGEA